MLTVRMEERGQNHLQVWDWQAVELVLEVEGVTEAAFLALSPDGRWPLGLDW